MAAAPNIPVQYVDNKDKRTMYIAPEPIIGKAAECVLLKNSKGKKKHEIENYSFNFTNFS
jgi:hypothetical protein